MACRHERNTTGPSGRDHSWWSPRPRLSGVHLGIWVHARQPQTASPVLNCLSNCSRMSWWPFFLRF